MMSEFYGTNEGVYYTPSDVLNAVIANPPWSPDPDVGCAVPDVLPVFLTALGAVVVAAALVVAAMKRVRRSG